MLKRNLSFMLLAFFVLVGCKNAADNVTTTSSKKLRDSSGQAYVKTRIPVFSEGDIYATSYEETKSDVMYSEYFSFTEKTKGNYSKYENGTSIKSKSFEFFTDLGVCSIGSEAVYFLSANNKIYKADLYGTPLNGNPLIGEWNIGIATVTFYEDGSLYGSNSQGYVIKGKWINNNGFIKYIDSDNEEDSTNMIYSSDGRLYIGVKLMQKVSYVGEEFSADNIDDDNNIIAKDSDGTIYAKIKKPSVPNGIYGYNIYWSGSSDLRETDFFDFSSDTLTAYANSQSASYKFEKSFTGDNLLKVYVSSVPYTYYIAQLEDNTLYAIPEQIYNNMKKMNGNNSIYGTYTISYNGFEMTITLNRNGTVTGYDSFGNISGLFSVKDGIVSMTYNGKTSSGTYTSSALKGIYYHDGSGSRLYLFIEKLLKADRIGGSLYE